jgi:Ca2+-binding RTX toxin-like protein
VPGTATIVGGDTVQLYLNPAEYQAAQDALFQLGDGFSDGQVLTSLKSHPIRGDLNIYNVPGGGIVSLPKGAQGIVLTGDDPTFLLGRSAEEVLIGNQGNDTISGNGGSGTIIAGDGNNLILTGPLFGGFGFGFGGGNNQSSFEIDVGTGNNTIVVRGGSDTINALAGGNDTIVLTGRVDSLAVNSPGNVTITDNSNKHDGTSITLTGGGNDTVQAGKSTEVVDQGVKLDFIGQGNDTVYLGAGTDTVTDAGSATVYGGAGDFTFTGGTGSDSVVVGSGDATLIGGTGDNVFTGGSGFTSMHAGSGANDTFIGGTGTDSMDGSGATSNVFEFDTAHAGGSHTIANFTENRDKIDLAGYDSQAVLNNAQVVGGDTILHLGDGTTITLTNFTSLKASDFTS